MILNVYILKNNYNKTENPSKCKPLFQSPFNFLSEFQFVNNTINNILQILTFTSSGIQSQTSSSLEIATCHFCNPGCPRRTQVDGLTVQGEKHNKGLW